jgi:hypothetical protein
LKQKASSCFGAALSATPLFRFALLISRPPIVLVHVLFSI